MGNAYFAGWNPDRWPDSCQDHVAWDLPNHISDRPRCLHVVQLVLEKTQILLPAFFSKGMIAAYTLEKNSHSRDKGIVDVGLVKVFDKVTQRREREQCCIQFEKEFAFFRRLVERVPDVALPFLAGDIFGYDNLRLVWRW